jgi:hypothetical protein
MILCTQCKQIKSKSAYYKRSDRPQPYRQPCKDCVNSKVDHRGHYNKNAGYYRSKASARKASKLKATPSWANQEQIKRIYVACAKINERTGIKHHVDHIIPLQGENVCGLHVENNLAIIPAKMNLQKSNKFRQKNNG